MYENFGKTPYVFVHSLTILYERRVLNKRQTDLFTLQSKVCLLALTKRRRMAVLVSVERRFH